MYCRSLNHIFLFDKVEEGLKNIFDGELWENIFDEFEQQFVTWNLSPNDILRCHEMSKVRLFHFNEKSFSN